MNHYAEAIKALGRSNGMELKQILYTVAAQNPAAITRAVGDLSTGKAAPMLSVKGETAVIDFIEKCFKSGDSRLYTIQKTTAKFPVAWATAVGAVDEFVRKNRPGKCWG